MHYYIDGYNLFFKTFDPLPENFQACRNRLIKILHDRVDYLKLNATLVFDAHHHSGEEHRFHPGNLEVVFTRKGQSADDFILEEIASSLAPHRETVVSSDRELRHRARNLGANVTSVEEFIDNLSSRFANKRRKEKKQPSSLQIPPPITDARKKKPVPSSPEPAPSEPSPGSLEYYLKAFQVDAKEHSPSEPEEKKGEKRKRKEPYFGSETERWLHIFEQRLQQPEDENFDFF